MGYLKKTYLSIALIIMFFSSCCLKENKSDKILTNTEPGYLILADSIIAIGNEFNPNINELWPGRRDFNMIEYIDVDVIRLDDFIKSEGIESIDFLHIDAQGSDLKVLQSLGTEVHKVKAGRCEAANTVELYKDVDNSANSIMKHLNLNGYYVKTIFNHFGDQIKIEDLPNSTEEVDIYFESITQFETTK